MHRYQEDAYTVTSVVLPMQALKRNVVSLKAGECCRIMLVFDGIRRALLTRHRLLIPFPGAGWMNDTLEGYPDEDSGAERKRQVAFFAVYDG